MEPINSFFNNDVISECINGTNMCTVLDLTAWCGVSEKYVWAQFPAPWDQLTKGLPDPPQSYAVVHRGQMYQLENGLVCEFLGFSPPLEGEQMSSFFCRIFESIAQHCEKCNRGTCANRSSHQRRYEDRDEAINLGMASRVIIDFGDLFWQNGDVKAVIVHDVKVDKCSGKKSFQIVLTALRGPMLRRAEYRTSEWEKQSAGIVVEVGQGSASLYSDGGWKQVGSLVQRLLERRLRCESAASVVCIPETQSHALSIKLEGVERGHPVSAYTTELYGIAMTTDIRLRCWSEYGKLVSVASDCKSAIKVSNKYWLSSTRVNSPTYALTHSINRNLAMLCEESESGGAQVRWVRAHAERRGTWGSWSYDELGMVMADEVASGHDTAIPHIGNTTRSVPFETFLRHIEAC